MKTSKDLAKDFTKNFSNRKLIAMDTFNGGTQLNLKYFDSKNNQVYDVILTLDGAEEILKIGLAARSLMP